MSIESSILQQIARENDGIYEEIVVGPPEAKETVIHLMLTTPSALIKESHEVSPFETDFIEILKDKCRRKMITHLGKIAIQSFGLKLKTANG